MAALVAVLALIACVPAVAGFFLGTSGSVWMRWLYVLGLPVAIGALGVYLMSAAEPPGPEGYLIDSEQWVYGLFTLLIAPVIFVANLIGAGIGLICRDAR